jgi:hypothetical protein
MSRQFGQFLVSFLFVILVFAGSAFHLSGQQTATDQKLREVTIYFWDANSKKSDLGLVPVKRMVVAAAPLRPALEALFIGPTKEEEARGLSSSTFGMRFEGVTLTDGVARVKFSQPKEETNYGSLGPAIFAEAIEKTARQFPTVKKLEICALGETLIDSQLEKPFPKCVLSNRRILCFLIEICGVVTRSTGFLSCLCLLEPTIMHSFIRKGAIMFPARL